MKAVIRITAAVLLALLCACSRASAAGRYRMVELKDEAGGLYITEANLTAMGEYGMELKEDGSGFMNMAGAVTELTWDEESITLSGSQPQPYVLQNGRLILQDEDAELTFVRED